MTSNPFAEELLAGIDFLPRLVRNLRLCHDRPRFVSDDKSLDFVERHLIVPSVNVAITC